MYVFLSLYIYGRHLVKRLTMRCHRVRRGGGSGGVRLLSSGGGFSGCVAPGVHFAPLQLDVDYLANGLKQLHAVVKKA